MADEISSSFPKILKRMREHAGFTQEELAQMLGIAPRTLRDWEGGRHVPQPPIRRKLYDVLDTTPEKLGLLPASGEETGDHSDQKRAGGLPTSQPVGTLLRAYDVHGNYVVAVQWKPCGSRIASAGGDGTVHVWDAETGQSIQTYRRHHWRFANVNWPPTIYSVKWSPDGLLLASVGDGSNVFVWYAKTGQTQTIYQGHSSLMSIIFDLAWSPDGTHIASACSSVGWDKTIHIWNASTGELASRLDASYGFINFSVLTLAWSPDGNSIAAACGDKTVRIWNVRTGQHLSTYRIHPQRVLHLAWSPDSQLLALVLDNRTAELWEALSGKSIMKYHEHSDDLRYIAWSPNGTTLATASNDRTVQLWDARTGRHIYTYRGHAHWVTSVAWSPTGTRLASASNDKTVHIWQAPEEI